MDGKARYRGRDVSIRLTADRFEYGNKFLLLADCVGCRALREASSPRCWLEIFAYPRATGCCAGGERAAKHVTIETTTATQWDATIKERLRGGNSGSRPTNNVLCLVNPFGGPGLAVGIFHGVVEPMLRQAGATFTLVVTERAGHARDMLRDAADLDAYSCVAIVGGDGLLFECVQGIGARPDADVVFTSLPFGVICGGSGNGLCKSILHASGEAYSPLAAAFVVAKGRPAALDLGRVAATGGRRYLSFLSMAWAITADIDIESERWRFLGSTRFTLGAVVRLVWLRAYPGRLSFLPAPPEDAAATAVAAAAADAAASMPSLEVPVPSTWTTVEDRFVMVWACQTSHASHNLHSAPGLPLGSGVFEVLVIRQHVPWLDVVAMFLALEDGGHVRRAGLEVHRCLAYRIEPLTEAGIYSLDGEGIEYGPVQAVVKPGMARVLTLHGP